METFLLIAALAPIVSRAMARAQKRWGKGKGKTKKSWAVKEIIKIWNESVESGLITPELAIIPVAKILTVAGSLIESLIGVIKEEGPKIKNPKTAKKGKVK